MSACKIQEAYRNYKKRQKLNIMFESIQIAATTGGWVWVTFVVAAALIEGVALFGAVIALLCSF